jgi:Na+/H+ antiporter NhaD/arsenite permease-like protein
MPFVAAKLGDSGILIAAVVLFLLTYVGMMAFSKARPFIALGSAVVFVVLGILPIQDLFHTIEWNVIMIIAGTMGTVALFIDSKMPARMADIIIDKSPNLKWAVILLSVFAGVISAFVDNVATVLMVAPIAVTVAKKLNISPVPSVIAIAIASNLQGVATLVGDTTSILLGQADNMNFLDFFYFKPNGVAHGGVGLFWIVQVAFLAATAVLFVTFRKENHKIHLEEKTEVTDRFPSALLLGTIVALILASFFPATMTIGSYTLTKPLNINGYLCMAFFIIGLLYYIIARRDFRIVKASLKEVDYLTLLLLASLFVVIGGLKASGAINEIGKLFAKLSGGNVFVIYTIIVFFSVLISAVVDNIPYVATMLPVVAVIASTMGVTPHVLYFGLLSGATLGGNLTPIGASANIAGLGILRKAGYNVKAGTFMKLSVPYTLTAVVVGYILVWVFWKFSLV